MKYVRRIPRSAGLVLIVLSLVGVGFFVDFAAHCKRVTEVTVDASGYVIDMPNLLNQEYLMPQGGTTQVIILK